MKVTTSTLVSSIYKVPASLWTMCGRVTCVDLNGDRKPDTLLDSLTYQGGTSLKGSTEILLRAATAGLLNEAYYGTLYPPYSSKQQLLNAVNAALGTSNRSTIIDLGYQIDYWNNGDHSTP